MVNAGKIVLKDGSHVFVPDKLEIVCDIEKVFFDGTRSLDSVKNEKTVSMAKEDAGLPITAISLIGIEVNRGKEQFLKTTPQTIFLILNGKQFPVKYPTYFHPERMPNAKPLELLVAFKYKLSHIMQGKEDQNGLTLQITDEEYKKLASQK